MKSVAWRIRGGDVSAHDIPEGGLEVDTGLTSPPIRLLPGSEHPRWRDYTLGAVVEAAMRTAPWCEWWCAPELPPHEEVGRMVGQAWTHPEIGLVTSSSSPRGALSTTFHEAMHLAEANLRYEEIMPLREATARGPRWPTPYLDRDCERLARMFEAQAMAWHEGASPPDRRAPADVRALWAVYSGDVGRRVLSRPGAVRAERRPRPAPVKVINWWRSAA